MVQTTTPSSDIGDKYPDTSGRCDSSEEERQSILRKIDEGILAMERGEYCNADEALERIRKEFGL